MQTRLVSLLVFICLTANIFAQLTIKVTAIPPTTPPNEPIHIAGTFQNWDPADPNYILTDLGNNQFQITITPPVGLVKYKFTRGSWATVEGTATGGFLPDREYNYTGGLDTVAVQIAGWEGLGQNSTAAPNVHLLSANFYMPQLDRYRRILIYLPPDYETSQKHYPVMYMHDGQNLFDAVTSFSGEWEVDESLNALFDQGDYGCIVVGIDNGGALRIDELAPWVNTSYNEGGEGAQYINFIVETLKPYIDQNYRTLSGRNYTAIMGSSLGGLISQYAIMQHQDVFSKAGDLSPAYWFNDPEVYNHSATTAKTGPLKIYQYAGQQEDNGSVVAAMNQMESVLLNNDFGVGELHKSVNPSGQHSEPYWREEFPKAYKWLFAGLNFSSSNEQVATTFKIYPNPTDSVINLENLPASTKLSYQIFSSVGKMVMRGKIVDGQRLDVSRLAAGCYVLQVFSKKKQVAVGQFIVK